MRNWFSLLSFLSVHAGISSVGINNCHCERSFDPICASDGKTYDSGCQLACFSKSNQDLSIVHPGPCCPLNNCSSKISPVCDNLGHTHVNECIFEHRKCILLNFDKISIEKVYDGICKADDKKPESCKDYCKPYGKEVCATDNRTYATDCHLAKTNCIRVQKGKSYIFVKYHGKCKTDDVMGLLVDSDEDDDDVSDIFNSTLLFSNDTEIVVDDVMENNTFSTVELEADGFEERENNTITRSIVSQPTEEYTERHSIPIPPFKIREKYSERPSQGIESFSLIRPCSAASCDKSWNPVCDSTNTTHKNLCLFKFQACKMNRLIGSVIELAHEGECDGRADMLSKCRQMCQGEPTHPFVCDNLNQTHTSICAVSQFNCFQSFNKKPSRVLVHIGKCHAKSPVFTLKDEQCPSHCSNKAKQVCDETGTTHRNLCVFQQKNCRQRKAGLNAPMLRYLRPCKRKPMGRSFLKSTTSKTTTQTTTSETIRLTDSSDETEGEEKMTLPVEAMTPVESDNGTISFQEDSVTVPTPSPSEFFECTPLNCSVTSGLPVCDSEGTFHQNICEFTYERCLAAKKGLNVKLVEESVCVSSRCKEIKEEKCPIGGKAVCGSDFSTYDNLCLYKQQKCKDSSLEILFNGRCSDCLESPCPVLTEDASDEFFVCDQQQITRSICEYQMLSCIVERTYDMNMTVQHLGRCCELSEECKDDDNSVCGSDGQSYKNRCYLDLENCRNDKLQVPQIDIVHQGECEQEPEIVENAKDTPVEPDTDCSSQCTKTWDPVCGTDENTYTNLCVLLCQKDDDVEIAYNGECCQISCPNTFDPVCDDQGMTHQNLCFFGRERCVVERITGRNLTISKYDVCANEDGCDMECSKDYKPICGSNDEMYINECELKKRNCFVEMNITNGEIITKQYDGECCPNLHCGFEFSPVCDSEGTTHANECIYNQLACSFAKKNFRNLTIDYKGQCCNQPCEDAYVPVCDGNMTHENMCRFRIAQCEAEKKDSVLSVVYPGECCSKPKGDCENSGKVCDSDGQTHENKCVFQQHKCVMEQTIGKSPTVLHNGECCEIQNCDNQHDAVCDTKGVSHPSFCHFVNSKCIYDKVHPDALLELSYEGKCCEKNCSSEWKPVCDQFGVSYANKCQFDFVSCEAKRKFGDHLVESVCPSNIPIYSNSSELSA